jgi:hypothetical protein
LATIILRGWSAAQAQMFRHGSQAEATVSADFVWPDASKAVALEIVEQMFVSNLLLIKTQDYTETSLSPVTFTRGLLGGNQVVFRY